MLSKFSVKKPYTIIVGVILVLILGTISFLNLQTDLLPEINLPYLLVMTNYPGASPEEVEMVVTKPIEQVVATTNNIKNINSVSRENSSIVILEFNNDVNMDSALIEINSSLDLIKAMWSDSISTPMIIRLNPDMLPVMIASVDIKDMNISEVSNFVNNRIIPELESVNGVASVTGVGILEEKVEVVISENKIDILNKKILNNLDSKLSEGEDKLLEAKDEIEAGREKLLNEEKIQSDKLSEGEKALSLAKTQIAEGEAAIKSGLEELNKNKTKLENGIREINQQEEELKAAEQLLLSLGDNLTQEDKVKLEGIKQGLVAVSQSKLEASIGLTALKDKMKDVEKEKSFLEEKKAEIIAQEEGLIKGKSTLATEINKAKDELAIGEATLNEKLDEFQISKEAAFKNSSIDGVISTKMISGILAAQNFSMPAGYVEGDGSDHLVKVGDKIKDIHEMEGLMLFDTGIDEIGKVQLVDVADISYVDNSKEIYAKVNGNNAVMLSFQKQSNFSTSDVSKSINDRIAEIKVDNPDVSIVALMDQGEYIDIVVDSVLKNIIYGGLLAILILFLFLRDIKPTFIIALSVPISIVFAIALMYFTGISINIISLAGLALGVGMLVDNSIVVIENIYRLRNEGMSARDASIVGAKEVSGAIFASTITTASVFLPIVFTTGISKQLFADMGLTIAYSLTASLVVALTLVPTLSSTILKKTTVKESKLFDGFINVYENVLKWSLKYKSIVMIFVVSLLVLSGYFAISMGTSFIPEMEAPQMSLSIEMPKESTSEDTYEMTDIVIDRLSGLGGIETIGAFQSMDMGMGMGGMMGGRGGGSMSLYILLDSTKKINNRAIEKEIMNATGDLDCTININASNMDMSALGGSGVEILVKGREIDELQSIAIDIGRIVEDTAGTMEVSNGINEELSEMRIIVDKRMAMENGLTVAQVFSHINTLLAKDKASTTLSVGNKDYPVIVIDEGKGSIGPDDLIDLKITIKENGIDKEIVIGDIAEVIEQKGLSSINRKAQERYLTVKAGIAPEHNIGLVSRDIEGKLKDYNLPDGYRLEFAGENEMIQNSLTDLIMMLALAIVFIYLIMVAQFQSLLSPFIIMFTIPLAFTGGLLAIVMTGNNISLISMLGFLVLSGVVVNNGIVFVDYTNQLRDKGIEINDALILAGKTRMRPILMTAITTMLGLSTLSVGVGVGSEMLQPLAIVAIGGLAYSTILTLLVVPVMYSLLHKNKTKKLIIDEDEL